MESAQQVPGSPRISKESSLETEKQNADVLTLKNSLEETLVCSPKSLKKIHPKKDSKSVSSGSGFEKNQQKRASLESPVNSNQVYCSYISPGHCIISYSFILSFYLCRSQ